MKKITLILIGFFCITAFFNAQNTGLKTYFIDHYIGGLADDGESIWVGVDSLLVKIDKISGETISHIFPISNEYLYSDRQISSILLDSNGLAWITCIGPLTYLETFDGENWTEIPLPTIWFSGLIIDKNDKVWASTILGLHEYDGTDWIDYVIASNTEYPYSATKLAVDNQNNKWLGLVPLGLGTSPAFLAKFDDTQFNMFASAYLDGYGGTIMSIGISPMGTIWMGTRENGLVKFDGTNWEVYNTSNSELPLNLVNNVTVEGSTVIWLSTESGLTRFDGEKWNTFNIDNSNLPSNNINSILIDENGTKWVGTDKGLVSFSGNSLGTSYQQDSGVQFKLFPNPAKDLIILKMPLNNISSMIEIYSIQGKSMISFETRETYNNINISDFANGFYFIKVKTMAGVTTQKFVKQ